MSEERVVPKTTAEPTLSEVMKRLEESIAWSKKVVEGQARVQRYMFWSMVGNFFRLAIIIVPLILALLFLPPLLKGFSDQFLGGAKGQNPYVEMLDLFRK